VEETTTTTTTKRALTLTHPSRFDGRTGGDDATFSLVIVDGPAKKASFLLGADRPPRVMLGKSAACDLVIEGDSSVSRRHAAIDLRGSHLTITDLSSTNGVLVNGVAVREANLRGNEVIKIGGTKIRVILEGDEQQTTQPGVSQDHYGEVWGASVEMRRVFAVAMRLSTTTTSIPILIEGERGTGKDLLAESIHHSSARAAAPFLVLDTASEPNTAVLSAILFGTGDREKPGLVELAEGGTLLIDEVARLDLPTQARLLRLLDKKEIGRVDNAAVPADVRVICATKRANLERDVEAGTFREDLLLRLAPGRIALPPLRRRDGDVTLLIERIWSRIGGELPDVPYDIDDRESEWPGNVRELEAAVVRRFVGNSEDRRREGSEDSSESEGLEAILEKNLPLSVARDQMIQEFERRYLERVLARANGNVVEAARAAGVARRYFQLLRARHLPRA